MSVGPLLAVALLACVVVAISAFGAALRGAARRPRVLCLMYHRVVPRSVWEKLRGTERIFSMPSDAFEAQIRWLQAHGWTFSDSRAVAAYARGSLDLPDRSVLLTVDDGCASVHAQILPVLRREAARAVAFVTTDPGSAIFRESGEGERRVSDDEIRQLLAGGVEIGSHAVSHRPLSAMPDEEIRRELGESKQVLERVTGRPVVQFAVPANWYDDRVLRIAREVGYEAVYCSRPGTVERGAGAFGIPRLNVEGHLDLAGFERMLSPVRIAQRRLVMAVRGWPKRLVGPRAWTVVRERLFPYVGGHWLSPSRMGTALALVVAACLLATLCWLVGG